MSDFLSYVPRCSRCGEVLMPSSGAVGPSDSTLIVNWRRMGNPGWVDPRPDFYHAGCAPIYNGELLRPGRAYQLLDRPVRRKADWDGHAEGKTWTLSTFSNGRWFQVAVHVPALHLERQLGPRVYAAYKIRSARKALSREILRHANQPTRT